jgi:hypothetical protein
MSYRQKNKPKKNPKKPQKFHYVNKGFEDERISNEIRNLNDDNYIFTENHIKIFLTQFIEFLNTKIEDKNFINNSKKLINKFIKYYKKDIYDYDNNGLSKHKICNDYIIFTLNPIHNEYLPNKNIDSEKIREFHIIFNSLLKDFLKKNKDNNLNIELLNNNDDDDNYNNYRSNIRKTFNTLSQNDYIIYLLKNDKSFFEIAYNVVRKNSNFNIHQIDDFNNHRQGVIELLLNNNRTNYIITQSYFDYKKNMIEDEYKYLNTKNKI